MYSPLNVSYISHPNVVGSQLELSNQFAEIVTQHLIPIKHYSSLFAGLGVNKKQTKKTPLLL